ncbi:MAG: alpha/beta fold hydrolase [Polyangiaceae bacterium]
MKRNASFVLAWALPAALQLLACRDETHPTQLGAEPAILTRTIPTLARPRRTNLDWKRCDLLTDSGTAKNAAECATMEVPLQRSTTNGPVLTLFVKRIRPVETPRGQLWLVNGGPGAPASSFEANLELFTKVGKDLEVYLLDHRGTGQSTYLECAQIGTEDGESTSTTSGEAWGECASSLVARFGEGLAGFNVTEAAADLGEAIGRTRHGDEPVFIYSVSYGTYLAQRYLQLYPTQPSGIVLDSICSPGACRLLLGYDRAFDETANDVFALCAKDQNCAEQLGDAPFERLKAVERSLDTGHCAALGWSKKTLRQIMGFMVMYVGLRDYMPAVTRRVERCGSNDVQSLTAFAKLLRSISTDESGFSEVLSTHIALSELSEAPLPSKQEILANVEELAASLDAGPPLADAVATWPVYQPDRYFGQFAVTSVPMLMLNGTLDPQTPMSVAEPVSTHFTATHQTFVRIPQAAHTTLTQSPIDENGNTCGAELIRQFYDAPEKKLESYVPRLRATHRLCWRYRANSSALRYHFSLGRRSTEMAFRHHSPWYANARAFGSTTKHAYPQFAALCAMTILPSLS